MTFPFAGDDAASARAVPGTVAAGADGAGADGAGVDAAGVDAAGVDAAGVEDGVDVWVGVGVGLDEGDDGWVGAAAVVEVPPTITGSAATLENTTPRAPVSRTTPPSMAPATSAT